MASEVMSVIASARSTVTHFLRHPFSAGNPGKMAPDHVPLLAPRLDEEAARARLRRNRILATGMLAGMGVVFTLTRLVPEPGFGTLLIQSGAEAGMVGGLADWFAVTALFR